MTNKMMRIQNVITRLTLSSFAIAMTIPILFFTGEVVSAQPTAETILSGFHYRAIGPTRQAGRTIDFAVPLQEKSTFYAATASGGLWKTINNGTTFFPIFEQENVIAIGNIAVAPSDPNVLWVGTGEPNNSSTDPYATYWGDGVYKSTDAGGSFKNMGLSETHQIGRVVIHPEDPDTVYVAAMGHLYSDNVERGVFKTTDGGATWGHSLAIEFEDRHVGVIDLVINPENPNILFAAAYDRRSYPWMYYEGGEGSGIYRSTDGGDSWTKLGNGLPTGLIGRIGLAIFPGNPDIVYASVLKGPSFQRRFGTYVYRSDDGGDSWQATLAGRGGITGGSYFGQLRVDPNDADHIFVLSFGVYHSKDAGKTWSKAFRWGGDNHALWIDPRDSRHMLLGYDYGFAKTYDSGLNWYHPDELPLAQLYGIGVDMAYPYNVYGGMQDFGTWRGPSTKKGRFPIRMEDWEHMAGGDGYYCQIDPVTNRWLYAESQNGGMILIDMKTGQRRGISYRGNRDLRFNFSAPILISPHNPNVVFQGANVVLRTSDRGASWAEISPDLTANNPELKDVGPLAYGTITSLDESPVTQGVLWVGTDDGLVQVTRDGGESWTNVTENITGNPGCWVSRVDASHHDAGTAYVSYTGRRRDDFRAYLYKTTDYGATWQSISSNLPDGEPVNVIREDTKNPNLLFVGTEKSVWVSLNGGGLWTRMRNNMPTNGIHDLLVHPRENDLVVGTHGRGFFITDISPLQEMTASVLRKDAHLFEIEMKVQWHMTHQAATSAQNFAGENEPAGVVVNYYLKENVTGEARIEVYDGTVLINVLTGSTEAGLNSVQWYMTKRKARSPEEVARFARRFARMGEEEDFYDYYDTVDNYRDADAEVDALGRSTSTRVGTRGPYDKNWRYTRVRPGRYTVKLVVGGEVMTGTSEILQDYWWDKGF